MQEQELDELVSLRRRLHQHPELAFEETDTADLVASFLEGVGIAARRGVGRTGVLGTLEGANPRKCVLIRADMDGLPVQEDNELPYRSLRPGQMHGCGHDGHVAMQLLVAKRLAQAPDFSGTVKFCFQPAEEADGGARGMIEEGVLQDPPVHVAFGIHIWNDLEVGKIGINPRELMASVDRFELTVRGRGGHGANPHQAIDPVVISAYLITSLQTIVSRVTSPLEPIVVTVGQIAGGANYNVIPDEVRLVGTIRTFSEGTWKAVPELFESLVRSVCQGMRGDYELSYERQVRPTINTPAMAEIVREAAAEVVGAENVVMDARWMAGEDFSLFLEAVPGCFFFVGSRNEGKGLSEPHHSPRFNFDEDALPIGVETMEKVVRKFLGQ